MTGCADTDMRWILVNISGYPLTDPQRAVLQEISFGFE